MLSFLEEKVIPYKNEYAICCQNPFNLLGSCGIMGVCNVAISCGPHFVGGIIWLKEIGTMNI